MTRWFTVKHSLAAIAMSACLTLDANAHASTLNDVLQRGDLNCGIYPDDPGRSALDSEGNWQGFYVDFCRAAAAAIFGTPDYINYVEVGSTSRFTSLMERSTDVVMYSSTWTLGREHTYQVAFPALYLFDGQGFIVRKSANIRSLTQLDDKTVCVVANSTSQHNLEDYIQAHQLNTNVVYANADHFFRGSVCDVYTADRMNLATNLANRVGLKEGYVVLPDTLSREPLSPTVRNDDDQWQRIIRSVVHATILAEEKGITRDNVDQMRQHATDIEVQNLLGQHGDLGAQLGLNSDWGYQVIKAVGNYGEIYNRHFGPNTPIGQPRGLNALWRDGGVLYAPPFK